MEETPLLFSDIDADFYLDIHQAARTLNVTERSIARYRVSKLIPCKSNGERQNFFRLSILNQIKSS
ncbi:MAG TPA: hypothetical protein PK079_24005 [Leptospiraceae bacterium]|nr:hypothetical protein [Leptospiraceae bacterium]